MANKVTASIVFDFKGETFYPHIELDLDNLMQRYHSLPLRSSLYEMLATKNNIGSHSYEHELLLGATIQFSDAKGDAISFFNHGEFDIAAYQQYWLQNKIRYHLKQIIQTELDINEAEQHPSLIDAMLAAFKFGQNYKQTLENSKCKE
ncbi:hypothetical protein LCGC14_0524230 [marine sediment metagenome]|uniref:Uncharacterized protein n=1 Tax=marine sediment metagenome TaxID=412755 RepID=A0A0F9V5R9_9ZZZZ|nr:hypothetical protein [Methylophaga sp.]HEC58124.1 hypothetical protein [Methylophaga sp.]